MQALADEDLMMLYRGGDYSAFEHLYQRHRQPLMRYLLRQLQHRASAEELFQEVWLKLIGARARYEKRARFSTYLYRIAHNCMVDYFRRSGRQLDTDKEADVEQTPAADANPATQVVNNQQAEQLLVLIGNLPDEQRTCFLLKEESGLSLEAIAEVTGCNAETAKSRLRYAVAKLREGLGEGLHEGLSEDLGESLGEKR